MTVEVSVLVTVWVDVVVDGGPVTVDVSVEKLVRVAVVALVSVTVAVDVAVTV